MEFEAKATAKEALLKLAVLTGTIFVNVGVLRGGAPKKPLANLHPSLHHLGLFVHLGDPLGGAERPWA